MSADHNRATHEAMNRAWDRLRREIGRMHPEHAEITEVDVTFVLAIITAEVRRWPRKTLIDLSRHRYGGPVQLDVHVVYKALGIDPPETDAQADLSVVARPRESGKRRDAQG